MFSPTSIKILSGFLLILTIVLTHMIPNLLVGSAAYCNRRCLEAPNMSWGQRFDKIHWLLPFVETVLGRG